MPGVPTGTGTFLFTDIDGSSRNWESNATSMAAVVEHHDEIVRQAIDAGSGYVFATGGDGFAAAFPSASDAVQAAASCQRAIRGEQWPDRSDLRVRMGLHTATAQERDGN